MALVARVASERRRSGVEARPVMRGEGPLGWASRGRAARTKEGGADRGQAHGEKRASEDACGLCGKTKRLTWTECCNRLICDDEGEYVPFSYARSSCSRNHRRYTLCGLHHMEGHEGTWKTCAACRKYCAELEMYVYYGTNEYNFEKLENPPAYKPTHRRSCGRVIALGRDGYEVSPKGYRCESCFED